MENAADEVPLPKSRSSGARRAKAMCAVRALGLREYMSLCRTQRLRLRPFKAGSDAQGAQGRCILDVRETLRNAAHQVPPSQSGFSSARRREATCAVRAFGLLEYSSLPARSALHDESRGERSGRGSALSKAGSDAQGAQGRCVLNVRETLRNAAHQVPLPKSRFSGARRAKATCTGVL